MSITLTAHDLSEDANRLSTQDDELILLVYAQDAAGQLPTSVIQEYFVLDTAQRMKSFILTDSVLRMRTLSIVLIEMDSNMGIQQLEPIVRLNLQTFLNQEQQASPDAFRKLLGDDDFLGAIKIETEDLNIQGKAIEFNGRRLFDSFHYEIVFTK